MDQSKWIGKESTYIETIRYLDARRKGIIKSIKTPWSKFNNVGVDGWEINSCVVICARPAGAKSLCKDQFVREVFDLNPEVELNVLEWELEMVKRVSVIREFASVLDKSYKYLCNVEQDPYGRSISVEDLKRCYEYAKERKDKTGNKIHVIYKPPTVEEFRKTIIEYMEDHKKADGSYTTTIITLDHARKILRGNDTETDMLYKLGGVINELKRNYPIIFVVLNHLLREVDKAVRNEPGTYGNYIVPSDIFGGDSLQQNADILMAFNIPSKQDVKYYGPSKYIMEKDTLVVHFLKVRNGEEGMGFFRLEGEKMRMVEIDHPPKAATKAAEYRQQNEYKQKGHTNGQLKTGI